MAIPPRFAPLSGAALALALGTSTGIWVSGCAAEITALPDLLDEGGIRAQISGIISPLMNTRSYASPDLGRRCRTFFLNPALRGHLASGHVDLCPWTYRQIMRWLGEDRTIDAAVVMVSPPDEKGHVSLGVQSDFLPLFRHRLGRMIAVVNPNMPFTFGDTQIPLDQFSAVFHHEQPLLTLPETKRAQDPQIERIAAHITAHIPDGATVQCGIGRIPQAVFARMRDHRGIRVHSGLVDDDILLLEDLGVLDRDMPVTTGTAMGSAQLYRRIDRNPRFHFASTQRTHSLDAIRALPRFRSVNAALQVDLFGQVNSEMVDGRMISVPGGFPDFLRGAASAEGGRAIIALQARGGPRTRPGIVASLSDPAQVSAAKTDIDIVVTEFGSAELRPLSMDQRAEALIAISAPEDQADLAAAWSRMRATALGRSPR